MSARGLCRAALLLCAAVSVCIAQGGLAAPPDRGGARSEPAPAQDTQAPPQDCAKHSDSLECKIDALLKACKAGQKKKSECSKFQASGNICDVDPTLPICSGMQS